MPPNKYLYEKSLKYFLFARITRRPGASRGGGEGAGGGHGRGERGPRGRRPQPRGGRDPPQAEVALYAAQTLQLLLEDFLKQLQPQAAHCQCAHPISRSQLQHL